MWSVRALTFALFYLLGLLSPPKPVMDGYLELAVEEVVPVCHIGWGRGRGRSVALRLGRRVLLHDGLRCRVRRYL